MDLGALASLPSPLLPFPLTPHLIEGGGRLFALLPPTTVWFLAFLLDVSTWSHEWKSVPKEEEEEEPTAATAATLGEVEEYWIYIYIYIYIPSISTFNEWMGVWWAWRRGSRGDSGWLLLRGDSGIPSIVSYVPASVWLDLFDSGFLSRLRDAREGGGGPILFFLHPFLLPSYPSIYPSIRPTVRPVSIRFRGEGKQLTHHFHTCIQRMQHTSAAKHCVRFIPFHFHPFHSVSSRFRTRVCVCVA